MTSLQMPVQIQLPAPVRRPWGLLVDAATQLEANDFMVEGVNRLGLGVQHMTWGCAPLFTGNASCDPEFLLNGEGPGFDSGGNPDEDNITLTKAAAILDFDFLAEHPAFKMVDALTCSVLSFPDINDQRNMGISNRLRSRMRVMSSSALMMELITGWASDGDSLAGGDTLTAAATVADAAAAIEEHLAETLHGAQGIVYIPPRLLAAAFAAYWVVQVNGQLFTVTGHKVVSDAGHSGDIGPTAAGAGESWIFASSQVAYRVSDSILLGNGDDSTVDISTNIRTRIAEAYGQLAFDPCASGAVLVG